MILKKWTIFPLFELCTDMIWTSTFWTFMQTRVPFIVLISSTLSIIPVVKVGLGRFSLNRIISSKVIEYPNHSTPFFVHLIHKLWLLYISKAYFVSSTYYAPQPVILWRLWFENKVLTFFLMVLGRFLGEITKQVFSDLEASKYQVSATCISSTFFLGWTAVVVLCIKNERYNRGTLTIKSIIARLFIYLLEIQRDVGFW